MREGGRGSKTTSDEDLTYIFLSGLSSELTEADIINAIAEHIRVFEIIKYQSSPAEGGEPAEDMDVGNSFCLKVSRFPDDVEGLRFVVSVLPGVGGRPVKAEEGGKSQFDQIKQR